MSETSRPDELLALLERAEQGEQSLPPVHQWEPDHQQALDMRIARDGTWYYQESPIRRERMVQVFSTVLRRDGDDYFLVTPAEKLAITVDDAPFVANTVECIQSEGQQKLVFTTNVDAAILASAEHPIQVVTDESTGEPAPYIHVRDNLWALIGRTAFYQLVDLAEVSEDRDGSALVITSGDQSFPLGSY